MSEATDKLRREIAETNGIVRIRKAQAMQAVRAGIEVPPNELLSIDKLEARLSNKEALLRLTELTIEPVDEEAVEAALGEGAVVERSRRAGS